MADAGDDDDKLTLAQQFFGRTAAILGRHSPESNPNELPEAEASSAVERHFPAVEGSPPTAPHLVASEGERPQRQVKTAAELAEMIEQDLARHPDCPKGGFRVTVYGGSSHWRAMLTITPAAGAVPNPGEWRDLTDEFAVRLRKRYDLAWEE
jgi:hypothetical protein